MKALVCFHGYGDHWLSKYFKRGFRHVFVVVPSKGYWVLYDAKMGTPEVELVAVEGFNIEQHYRERGFKVLPVGIKQRNAQTVFMLGTCVGAAKRILGIGAPFVWTPYQLYRYLRKSHG